MDYLKYNPKNTHNERCTFEQWDSENKQMGYCGEPAIGRRGSGKNARPLCEFHFSYCWGNDGSPRVKMEDAKR